MTNNLNIQAQNLRTLSTLDMSCNLTATQIILIAVGVVIVTGLICWKIKKILK